MPASSKLLSQQQIEELMLANPLSQSKKGGFQKGNTPWNKGTRVTIDLECEYCGKPFKRDKSNMNQINHQPGRFCSKVCFYEAKKQFGKRAQIKEQYEQGKTIGEIGDNLGIPTSTISGYLYRMKIAKRFKGGDGIFSETHRKKILKILKSEYGIQECELCGYHRTFDIAHILEKKNGGEYLIDNCIALCPNCHHLFDNHLLTELEKSKLKQIKRLNSYLQGRLI